MDDLVVDRRADRRRIPVIPLERRRRARLRDALLRQRVQIRRAHTWRHGRRQFGEHFSNQTPGLAQALELGSRSAHDHDRGPPDAFLTCAPLLAASIAAARSAATQSGGCAPLIDRKVGRVR